jgi:addiction module HigA family antidote
MWFNSSMITKFLLRCLERKAQWRPTIFRTLSLLSHTPASTSARSSPRSNLSPGALAKAMGLKDRTRIERLVSEQQSVTADTALRLAKVFGASPQFWINMQTGHDLSKAAIAAREELAAIQPLVAA